MNVRKLFAVVSSLSVTVCMMLGLPLIVNAAPIVLKVAHTSAPKTVIYATYEKFKTELEKRSNGAVQVKLYPLSQLGGDVPSSESVLKGAIDIASCGTNNMAPFTSLYFWADLPFMFESINGVHKVYGGQIGEEFKQKLEAETGFKCLFYADPGSFRDMMTTKKVVHTPADMAGLKFRSASSPVEMDTVRSFGAAATPVSWTEAYMALEQHVVDGEMQQYHWAVTARHEEVIRHVCRVPAQHALHLALVNKKKFETYSPEVQKWIIEAAKAAQDFNFANAETMNDELIQSMRDAKVTFYQPTQEELALWKKAGQSVWSKYADKVPVELIERIQRAQQ